MSLGREFQQRSKVALPPLVFLTITAYFAWNATQGDHGLVAFNHRQELLHQVVAEQAAAEAERDAWKIRVDGLRASHLNPDTLDERARAMLNLAKPDEVIVKLGPHDKLF